MKISFPFSIRENSHVVGVSDLSLTCYERWIKLNITSGFLFILRRRRRPNWLIFHHSNLKEIIFAEMPLNSKEDYTIPNIHIVSIIKQNLNFSFLLFLRTWSVKRFQKLVVVQKSINFQDLTRNNLKHLPKLYGCFSLILIKPVYKSAFFHN